MRRSSILPKLIAVYAVIFSSWLGANQTSANTAVSNKQFVAYGLNIDNYEKSLLEMALNLKNTDVKVSYYPAYLPRGREFTLMENSQGIDVTWGSATESRENRFHAIRIPIYKGLIGWRLALVTNDDVNLFASVEDLGSFKQFTAGQNLVWTDTKILNANDIVTHSGSNKRALAEMLVLHRFDYFPRSVIEVERDLNEFSQLDLAIEPHIFLTYPTAYYFYVSKDNTELANAIESGLKTLQASGQFDQHFYSHFADLLLRLNLNERTQIILENPLLPSTAPIHEKNLWLRTTDILKFVSSSSVLAK